MKSNRQEILGTILTRRGYLLLVLFSWILISEVASMMAAGGYGSFLWVTLHFILNPVLALFYVVITLVYIFREKGNGYSYLKALYLIPPIGFIYISISGNIYWTIMIQNTAKTLIFTF